MKKLLGLIVAVGASALLYACGGSGGDQPLGVASNTTLATNSTVAAAVVATPFSFPSGVPALGTTAATTVTFTSTSTAPAFNISEAGGRTATGTTSFGSCIFAVTASTFPAGHPLALGQTVTVNPCNLSVGTTGAVANGVATSRSIALLLGAAASSGQSATVNVNPGGQLTLNGQSVGQVTLTPVSG
ncbi:hypothetical protein [Ramlibacter albus]|uniref:Uncharacterized protein n=1 Tax=Ramlibacter albus TaxID=2079448 RepID=A0A923M6W4_9BURK|nr:hypothetical protein [Ramlibacter albus]MBC5765342.1 hypothetical protein [Ramlibacter albus]